jgi:hypothetical protein
MTAPKADDPGVDEIESNCLLGLHPHSHSNGMIQAVAWGAMRSLEHASSAASVISKISQVKSVFSNDTDQVLLRLLDSIATRADMLRAPLNFCTLWCQNKSSSIAGFIIRCFASGLPCDSQNSAWIFFFQTFASTRETSSTTR